MRLLACWVLMWAVCRLPTWADVYIPVGLGHRVHICGNVVDENLRPVMDTLGLVIRVERPLISLVGRSVQNEYRSKIMNSKFCVDASYALTVYAFLEGKGIVESPFRVEYRGLWKEDFKWVVERNSNIAKNPDFQSAVLSIDSSEKSWGYSIGRGRFFYSEPKPIENVFLPKWIRDLIHMDNDTIKSSNQDSLYTRWNIRHPKTIIKQPYGYFGGSWTITQPKLLLDYFLLQRKDSLFFVPGPLAKTKFAIGSLDTPVCNFGRMPPPPSIGNAAWKDTLLVAVGDSVVIDGFYVHFPWANIWGKANISRKVKRVKSKIEVTVSHIFAPVGDTKPFVYFDVGDENRKCLTKVEAMWEGEYKTIFIGER